MSSHHEDHHNTESKPVSFTVPFLMACSLLIIIIMFLSLCDPKHGHGAKCEGCTENCSKECMEACEKGDHSLHPAKNEAKVEESTESKTEEPAVADTSKTSTPEVKSEETHH